MRLPVILSASPKLQLRAIILQFLSARKIEIRFAKKSEQSAGLDRPTPPLTAKDTNMTTGGESRRRYANPQGLNGP
jgi:hypothetical protein